MPHPLEAGTIRILKPDSSTAGTGFLVSKKLAVTCAHVVESAKAKPGGLIQFKYHLGDLDAQEAKVLENGWSTENDVAILELTEKPPRWVRPIIMQSSRAMEGRAFQGLGYPDYGEVQICWAQGNVAGHVDVVGYADPLLQIQGEEIDVGLSGTAVIDQVTKRVLGMLTGYRDLQRPPTAPQVRFAYAIPIETIWKIYPDIKKEVAAYQTRSPLVQGIDLLPYDYAGRIQNFLTEYLGTLEQPEPFGGREDALSTLDNWLDSDTQRLLLAAPAGRGKSALLVRWLDRLIARENLAIVFVPVSVRFRTNLASTFFASLAARLAYLHGDDLPYSVETATDVWRGLANTYLNKPLADEKKLLVVLDGLDEAGDWEAAADLIPAELPSNIRVVVSARLLSGDSSAHSWLLRLGWERKGTFSALKLLPLDLSGVSDVLRRIGFPLAELSHRVDIIAELLRLSEGDPLLIHLYVEDLWARGQNAADLQPEDLKSINPGYKGYFDRWWDDQKKLWGKDAPLLERKVQLVFDLLCGAMGGLTKDDLDKLDTENILNTHSIEFALGVLKRFVIGVSHEHQQTEIGYVLTHPKLHEYFWNRLTDEDRRALENRFFDWGEQILRALVDERLAPGETPHYLLHYYGAHLERSHAPAEKFSPFVDYPHWRLAWSTYEGAFGGYLQDVKRAWRAFQTSNEREARLNKKVPFLGKEIRCALIETSLHSMAGNILPELLVQLVRYKIWTAQQAWAHIRQMSDSSQQVESIVGLIQYLSEIQSFEALKFVRSTLVDEDKRALVLDVLAQRMPEDVLSEILFTALELQEEARARVLNVLISRSPETLLDELLNAVRSMQSQSRRIQMLSSLAYRIPEAASEAFEIVYKIKGSRFFEMNILAEYLPETQLMKLLQMTRAEVMDIEIRARDEDQDPLRQLTWDDQLAIARILNNLVERLPLLQLEDLAKAIQASDILSKKIHLPTLAKRMFGATKATVNITLELGLGLDDEWKRAEVFSEMAGYVAEKWLGKLLKATLMIQNELARTEVLCNLAPRLPKIHLNSLLQATYSIQSEWEQIRIFRILADQRPEIAQEALMGMLALQNRENHSEILCDLALRLPETQLADLIEPTRQIHDEGDRTQILCALATRLPEAQLAILVQPTRQIRDEGHRANMLTALAQRIPEDGLAEVLILALEIQETLRVEVLRLFSKRLSQNMFGRFLEALKSIESEELLPKVVFELSHNISQSQLPELLQVVYAFQSEQLIAIVLGLLAQRWPELTNKALEAAGKINNVGDRGRALSFIVKRLPEDLPELLEIVDTIAYENQRAEALYALALRLPEWRLDDLLAAASKIKDEKSRSDVLNILVELTPKPKLGKLLAAINELHDQEIHLKMLIRLAQRLPEAAHFALEGVRIIQPEGSRARLLGALAPIVPDASEAAISALTMIEDEKELIPAIKDLVAHLPDSRLNDIFDLVCTIETNYWERAQILISLLGRFPKAGKEALKTTCTIRDEWTRIQVLYDLTERLPDYLLSEFLEVVRNIQTDEARIKIWLSLGKRLQETEIEKIQEGSYEIQTEWAHVHLLMILTKKIPIYMLRKLITREWSFLLHNIENQIASEGSLDQQDDHQKHRIETWMRLEENRSNLIESEKIEILNDLAAEARGKECERILELSIEIKDEWARMRILNQLIQNIPETKLEKLLQLVGEALDYQVRAQNLSNLSYRLISVPNNRSYVWFKTLISTLSSRTRRDLFSDIEALLPFLLHIGPESTASEIYSAVRDVSTWRP